MKNSHQVALLAVVAALLASWLTWSVWGKGASEVGRAQKLAAAELIDPSSAQFRNVRVSKYLDRTVCGEINGKNRIGAYTGFTEFVVSGDRVSFPPPPGAEEFHQLAWEAARGFCD